MSKRFTYWGSKQSLVCSAEGLSFIAAHEAATGSTMGDIQKTAICGFVSRLMGNDTTFGTNLWTMFDNNNTKLWTLTPIDDSTANAAAYNVELMSASTLGTYNNFISGDFTPNGVIGGSTKYFDTGVSPNGFGSNNFATCMYSRTNVEAFTSDFGALTSPNSTHYLQTRRFLTTSNRLLYRHNTSTTVNTSNSDSRGLFLMNRNGNNNYMYRNGTQLVTTVDSGNLAPSHNLYFHALNNNGTTSTESSRQLALYATFIPYLNANENVDFYEAVQWYQSNVITGGRNV